MARGLSCSRRTLAPWRLFFACFLPLHSQKRHPPPDCRPSPSCPQDVQAKRDLVCFHRRRPVVARGLSYSRLTLAPWRLFFACFLPLHSQKRHPPPDCHPSPRCPQAVQAKRDLFCFHPSRPVVAKGSLLLPPESRSMARTHLFFALQSLIREAFTSTPVLPRRSPGLAGSCLESEPDLWALCEPGEKDSEKKSVSWCQSAQFGVEMAKKRASCHPAVPKALLMDAPPSFAPKFLSAIFSGRAFLLTVPFQLGNFGTLHPIAVSALLYPSLPMLRPVEVLGLKVGSF